MLIVIKNGDSRMLCMCVAVHAAMPAQTAAVMLCNAYNAALVCS